MLSDSGSRKISLSGLVGDPGLGLGVSTGVSAGDGRAVVAPYEEELEAVNPVFF